MVVPVDMARLVFRRAHTLPDGDQLLIAEYGKLPPNPTLLGTLLIQKQPNQYLGFGPVVALHLSADQGVKTVRLIPKMSGKTAYVPGHYFRADGTTAHFITFNKGNPKNAQLVDIAWDLLTTDTLTTTQIAEAGALVPRFNFFQTQLAFELDEQRILIPAGFQQRLELQFE